MVEQRVVDYVKNSLDQGFSKEDIYKQLLNQGVAVDDIAAILKALSKDNSKEENQKRTIRIVVIIAAVLIGAGIFSFIASNWKEIGSVIKVFIILFFMLLTQLGGWFIKNIKNHQKTGEALIFLGAIIYGAGIFLVAQIFNIRANWPDGFILWMMGAILLAYAAESFSILFLAILLGFVAVLGHPFNLVVYLFEPDKFLMTSTFLLILATIITFASAIFINKKYHGHQ